MLRASKLAPEGWPDDRVTIANLGHSTLLMNFRGVMVLSDPALFARVGPSLGLGITIGRKRLSPAPLSPTDLRMVRLILITHEHADHFDIPSLKALPKTATVVTSHESSRLISPLGFDDVRELKWGDSTEVDGLRISAVGARHWGTRWPPFGRQYGFNSYVLAKDGCRMLHACDSAYTDIFGALKSAGLEVAAFSNGAYDPWIRSHANPEQVWRMFKDTGARWLVPLHWGTFHLSKEPVDEPMRRLIAAAGAEAWRIVLREIGAAWTMPAKTEPQARRARG